MEDDKVFRLQYHTESTRNYQAVVDILKKVIAENKLKIEVTEVNHSKVEELEKRLVEAEQKTLTSVLTYLTETFPENSDGPYRCGAWFAKKIEEYFKQKESGE